MDAYLVVVQVNHTSTCSMTDILLSILFSKLTNLANFQIDKFYNFKKFDMGEETKQLKRALQN